MGRLTGICKYCGEVKPFAKSHVISKMLFKDIFRRYNKVHLLNAMELDGNNKVQDAFYDTHILCVSCDTSFSYFEDYFSRLIRGELLATQEIERVLRTDSSQYMIDRYSIDPLRLRLFYLLTLWRCSISNQSDFSAISLGEDENELCSLLKAGQPGDYSDYATVLVSFADVDDIRALTATTPVNATVDSLPITVILFDKWAMIYCLRKQVKSWFFKYALDDSGYLSIILFKESFGIEFLDLLTKIPIRLKENDIRGLA